MGGDSVWVWGGGEGKNRAAKDEAGRKVVGRGRKGRMEANNAGGTDFLGCH